MRILPLSVLLAALALPAASRAQITPSVIGGVVAAGQKREVSAPSGWTPLRGETGAYADWTAGLDVSWRLVGPWALRSGIVAARRGFRAESEKMSALHLELPLLLELQLVRVWGRALSVSGGAYWSHELRCSGEFWVLRMTGEDDFTDGTAHGCDTFRSKRRQTGLLFGAGVGPWSALGHPLIPEVQIYRGAVQRIESTSFYRFRDRGASFRLLFPLR